MDVVEFQSREEVRVALESVKRVAPSLSPMRDGVVIEGLVCRLTIGTLALLQSAQNEIFFSEEERIDEPLSDYAIFECLWMCDEANLDMAVNIAAEKEVLKKEVNKLMGGYGRRGRAKIHAIVSQWIRSQIDTVEQMGTGEGDDVTLSADWWVDSVDIIASNYGWSEEFILWRMPLVRAMKYQEAIALRLNSEQRSSDINDNALEALKLFDEERQAENG
jgi:hypothetical protein